MINLIKNKTLRVLTVLAAVASVLAVFNSNPAPTSAASGCAENRDTALNLVSTGNYVEAAGVDIMGAKVRLLYSSGSGCMWGKIQDIGAGPMGGRLHAEVWVERTTNGGVNWSKVGKTYNDGLHASVFTSAYNTMGYNAVRVCGATAVSNVWDDNPYEPMETLETACSKSFWPGRLYPGMYLGHRGFDCLSSQNNRYVLCMQYDGNLVLYSAGRAVWYTNTFRTASKLHMQGDGNLVVYDYNINPVWSTGTHRHPGSFLNVQSDGNMVIYNSAGAAVWASNTTGR